MNLIEQSYERLFPDKVLEYTTSVEYNRRLSDFNANIKLRGKHIHVALNLQWKDIDNEIKIGLVQHLLLKLMRQKKSSSNVELYHHFIRTIPTMIVKANFDPILKESFERMSLHFFGGHLEKPNLVWGTASTRRLAHYNFHSDTITVSTIFREAPVRLLDYVMYHEMLHKFHQFKSKDGRDSFHSPTFRADEKRYPGFETVDAEIHQYLRSLRSKEKKSFLNRMLGF